MKLNWKDKKVTVMGLGLHGGGVSVAKFFIKQKAQVTVTDLRSKSQLEPSLDKLKGLNIRYVLGKHQRQDFIDADLVVQNPGVPNNSPFLELARDNNVQIENEASLFFLLSPAPIIGITGTKGKSTVTTLIGEIIKKHKPQTVIAGNIRTNAMLDMLPRIKKNTPVVLELSSWQLEGLAKHQVSPKYALVTNVLDDHLNRYTNFEEYCNAKSIIFKFQDSNGTVILNYDNPATRKFAQMAKGKVIWFSVKPFPVLSLTGAFIREKNIVFGNLKKNKTIMNVNEVKIPGQHNLENVLAAVALAKSIGITDKLIRNAIIHFKGIPSRLETIATFKGVKFINDTTATAPIATLAGIQALENKGRIILIAGGQDKGLDYQTLSRAIENKVDKLFLLPGTASLKIRSCLRQIAPINVKNMIEAVKRAFQSAQPGDIVLLSPAAASFNLFNNEFHRGEEFIKAVKNLQ